MWTARWLPARQSVRSKWSASDCSGSLRISGNGAVSTQFWAFWTYFPHQSSRKAWIRPVSIFQVRKSLLGSTAGCLEISGLSSTRPTAAWRSTAWHPRADSWAVSLSLRPRKNRVHMEHAAVCLSSTWATLVPPLYLRRRTRAWSRRWLDATEALSRGSPWNRRAFNLEVFEIICNSPSTSSEWRLILFSDTSSPSSTGWISFWEMKNPHFPY